MARGEPGLFASILTRLTQLIKGKKLTQVLDWIKKFIPSQREPEHEGWTGESLKDLKKEVQRSHHERGYDEAVDKMDISEEDIDAILRKTLTRYPSMCSAAIRESIVQTIDALRHNVRPLPVPDED